MKEMRSAVCKRANELVKTGYYTKSRAFRQAWQEIKWAANNVKPSELKAGDVIRVKGDNGNAFRCKVVEVSASLFLGRYHIIKAVGEQGYNYELCARPDELIEKAA